MEMNPVLVWFLVGLALALIEFVLPGVLMLFFAAGAWITALTSFLNVTDSLMWQIIVFTGSSVILLLGLREWVKGKLYGHVAHEQNLSHNLDDFAGKHVQVMKDVVPGRNEGAVELKGAVWTVIADDHFSQGETATVIGTEGIALKISKAEV